MPKILLSLGSLIITLVMLEVIARLVFPYKELPFGWATGLGEPVYRIDDSTIWSLTPNLETIRTGKNNQQHSTDKHGFRKTRVSSLQAGPETTYILMVGDSYTYGDTVHDEETTAAQLQTLLNAHGYGKYVVVNLGVSGFGPDQSFRLIVDKATALYPNSIIVWSLSHNDHSDSHLRSQTVVLGRRLLHFPASIHGMYWAARLHVLTTKFFPQSRIANVLENLLTQVNPLGLFWEDEMYFKKMQAYEAYLTLQGHDVQVFQLPSQAYLESELEAQVAADYLVTEMQEQQRILGAFDRYHDSNQYFLHGEQKLREVSDVDRLFLTENEDAEMPKYERHLSVYGNQMYASYLFRQLTAEGIIQK